MKYLASSHTNKPEQGTFRLVAPSPVHEDGAKLTIRPYLHDVVLRKADHASFVRVQSGCDAEGTLLLILCVLSANLSLGS